MNQLSKEIPFKIPPVVKVVDYAGTPEQAFARFSEQIGVWWPLATHSVAGKADGVTVALERLEAGGRLVERWRSGEVHVWGTITTVDRPHRLTFSWHVGRGEDAAQLVDITFAASGPDQTKVRLVHSGWESLGDTASEKRDAYDQGWIPVLRFYATGEMA